MDILYVFKENELNNSDELRYSLRSLKNIPHDNVIISGDLPDWARNVTHIPVSQTGTKYANAGLNRRIAIESGLLSDDFVLMNDDFFILKPVERIEHYNGGSFNVFLQRFYERYPEGSPYIDRLQALHDQLSTEGYDNPLSYELHMPMLLNCTKITQMYQQLPPQDDHPFRTRYGNFYSIGGKTIKDVKLFNDLSHNESDYNAAPFEFMDKMTVMSSTGGSFDHGTPGDYVKRLFDEPSPYEVLT